MRLNRLESWLVTHPLREVVQRRFEARRLLRLGPRLDGGRALEIGCGPGTGVSIILDTFGAATVDAFDLDGRLLALARRRHAGRPDVRLWIGSADAIAAPSDRYDAVFDFGVLHHVPDWRAGLREVHRVLRPRGLFYAEEVFRGVITNPVVRRLLDHPQEDRFDRAGFLSALGDASLDPIADSALAGFGWVVARKR